MGVSHARTRLCRNIQECPVSAVARFSGCERHKSGLADSLALR